MLSRAQIKQRRDAGKARAKSFTSQSQRQVRACRSHESLSESGRKGYIASVKAGRILKALEGIRKYMANRISLDESDAIRILDEMGLSYERNAIVECNGYHYLIDFILSGKLAIEVNGGVHDRLDVAYKAEAQRRKLTALSELGYETIVLDYKEKGSWRKQIEALVKRKKAPLSLETSDIPF